MTALTSANVEPVTHHTTLDSTSGATTPTSGNGGDDTEQR